MSEELGAGATETILLTLVGADPINVTVTPISRKTLVREQVRPHVIDINWRVLQQLDLPPPQLIDVGRRMILGTAAPYQWHWSEIC